MKKIMSVKDFKFEQGVVCRNSADGERMKDLIIKLGGSCMYNGGDWVFFPNEVEHCDLPFARDKGFDLVEYSDIVILEDYFRDVKRSLESFENGWAIVISNREQWDLFAAYCDLLGVRNLPFPTKVSLKCHEEFPVAAFPKRGKGLSSYSAAVLTSNNFVISFEHWVKGGVNLKQFKKDAAEKTLPSIPMKDFKDSWTIWCDTEAEWKELMHLGTSEGVKWRSGAKLTALDLFTHPGTGFLPAGDGTPLRATFKESSDTEDYLYIRFKDWKAGSRTFSVGRLDSVVKLDIIDKLPATEPPTAQDLMSSLEKSVVDGKEPASTLASLNLGVAASTPTSPELAKAIKFIKDFGVVRNPYLVEPTGGAFDFTKYMEVLKDRGLDPQEVSTTPAETDKKEDTPYKFVQQEQAVKTTEYQKIAWSFPTYSRTCYMYDELFKDQLSPELVEKVESQIGYVSSPAKKENSMLAPLVFVSSAVRRAAWSALDWAFVSPIKKTVKPVGTVAQFTICYTTLALIGYLAYSAYSDPTAMVSWISELSPVEIRFKQPQE